MKEDSISKDLKKETTQRFIYAYEHRNDNMEQFHDMLYYLALICEINRDIPNIENFTAEQMYSIVKM